MMMITSVALWISAPLAPARAASPGSAITCVPWNSRSIERVAAAVPAPGASSTGIVVASPCQPADRLRRRERQHGALVLVGDAGVVDAGDREADGLRRSTLRRASGAGSRRGRCRRRSCRRAGAPPASNTRRRAKKPCRSAPKTNADGLAGTLPTSSTSGVALCDVGVAIESRHQRDRQHRGRGVRDAGLEDAEIGVAEMDEARRGLGQPVADRQQRDDRRDAEPDSERREQGAADPSHQVVDDQLSHPQPSHYRRPRSTRARRRWSPPCRPPLLPRRGSGCSNLDWSGRSPFAAPIRSARGWV